MSEEKLEAAANELCDIFLDAMLVWGEDQSDGDGIEDQYQVSVALCAACFLVGSLKESMTSGSVPIEEVDEMIQSELAAGYEFALRQPREVKENEHED